ncbi:DNA polymerase zeta catalytic subunit [Ixodes scapularis]
MSFVNVGKFKFRRANLDLDSSKLPVRNSRSDTHVWVLRDMPPDMFLDLQVQKQTTCELELDCSSEDIVNPRDAGKGEMNPGLSALWRDEEERRARRGDASTLVAPLSHDRLGVMKTDSELFYIRKLDKLLRAAQSTDSPSQASPFKHAAGRRTPSSGVLSAVGDSASQILDSQDLSLAEMLARVTANESWADLELSRDADSVLSVRCSQRSGGSGQQQPIVEDEEEEDEEEQTTREMSQVFNLGSECLDAPELRGPIKGRPAPRSGSSSSSSDSEGDQPYSPSQLDGTDDGSGRPSNTVTGKPSSDRDHPDFVPTVFAHKAPAKRSSEARYARATQQKGIGDRTAVL